MPMMLLQQTTTPIPKIIVGETSQAAGSTIISAPICGLQQPVDKGQTSSAAVSTQSTPMQAPLLTVIPSNTTLPTVEDVNATPSFFQQPPPNQMVGTQSVVFQTPPPPNQMAGTQPTVFQTPPLSQTHIFAWIPTDIVGVDRKVIELKLMIKPGSKETKQEKMVHGGDRQEQGNQH
ncbi:unnamed protein product [Lactuca saligna]|uniref:Uncharacterized protein n=1 Tax=Lactuca saligna TaxID=75948 RepID=A0AA35ZE96_LACSI|nr:unnamed protein product [Lactuca saligna]